MVKPYKCNRVLVRVGSNNIGLVEGFISEMRTMGGVEANFKSNLGRHVIGGGLVNFGLKRWMFVDPNQKRLLYDLWKNKTAFMLYFGLYDEADASEFELNTQFVLSDCRGYRWRPITGHANDIVAEELVGQGTNVDWIECGCDLDEEMVLNGTFETGNLNGWNTTGSPSVSSGSAHGGTYKCVLGDNNGIDQDISIQTACVKTFSLWYRGTGCWGPLPLVITITYTDATTTVININVSANNTWYELDIVTGAYLEAGKTISNISILEQAGGNGTINIDDVTMTCVGND